MRILLVGYYGYGNLGDELLSQIIYSRLVQEKFKVTILDRAKRPIQLLVKQLAACDTVVYGGGSLFQDVTGRGLTVIYYCLIGFIALLLKKKIVLVGQGLGPVRRPLNRWLLKLFLSQVSYIGVRNKESAAFLEALGIQGYALFNDLVFAYSGVMNKAKKKQKKINIVYSFKGKGTSIKIPNAVQIAMHKGQDFGLADPKKIFKAIAQADLAVGMRLHFLILAALHGVPFIGIAYDPKVEGLCRRLEMPCITPDYIGSLSERIPDEVKKIPVRRQQLAVTVRKEKIIALAALEELVKELYALR
jgi:polysaccharide pyruvyl transferase WcaK-like protein